MDRVEELRERWHTASENERPRDAVKALVELEQLEPHEPRWSQRLAESYRRAGQEREAIDAFARAFQRYFERGFLPRAIAMAKLVTSLDAKRGNLLEASLPKPGAPPAPIGLSGSRLSPAKASATPDASAGPAKASPATAGPAKTAPAAPAPTALAAKTKAPLEPTTSAGPGAKAVPFAAAQASVSLAAEGRAPAAKATPLTRAEDSRIDEVRFVDSPESSLMFSLVEFIRPEDVASEPPVAEIDVDTTDDADGAAAYAAMASFRLFASLSRDALLALADAAEVVEFDPGARIIVRDEPAFALYAIVSGAARVSVAGSDATIPLKEGDVFGEASLLDDGERQADVRAETALMTLRIEKAALDEVTRRHAEVEDALFDLLARRLITNLMQTSPLFASFEPAIRLELAKSFEVRRAPAGTVLAERGRRSDGLYVLLAGTLLAEKEARASVRIARGTAFGHASLLGSGTAETTVRTTSEAVLLRMPAAGFTSLAALYPPALAYLAETASEPPAPSRRPR